MRWPRLVVLCTFILAACRTSPLAPLPCPCAYEWTCCADQNICVREGTACPAAADLGLTQDGGKTDAALSEDAALSGDADAAPAQPITTCATGRWCWLTPQPTGDNYAGLWGSAANDLWMATESGSFVHFDGAKLDLKYQSTFESFTGTVGGRSANDVWFVLNDSNNSHVIHWDGAQFADLPLLLPGVPPLYALAMTAKSAWLAGEAGTLLQSPYYSPGQYSFAQPPATPVGAVGPLIDVWAADDDHVWALGSDGTSYSGGATASAWTAHDPREGLADPTHTNVGGVGLWGSAANDVWEFQEEGGVAYSGMVFRHFDGSTWTRTQADYCPNTYQASGGFERHVWASAANDIWVSGRETSCDYHWDGSTWSTSAKGSIYDLIFSEGVSTFAAGDRGQFQQLSAGAWTALATPIGADVKSISALSSEDVFAIDSGADVPSQGVVHFDGAAWTSLPQLNTGDYPPYEYPLSVYAAADDDLWVAGYQTQFLGPNLGFIQHWNGTAWDAPLSIDQPASAMWGVSSSDVWVGGVGWLKRWNGQAWSDLPSTICTLAMTGVGDQVFIHGTSIANPGGDCSGDELLLHWDGATLTAMPAPGVGNQFPAGMHAFSATDLWSVDGGIAHWDGTSWTQLAVPPDTTISAVWGARPDQVWFAGAHLTRAALLRWDGVNLTEDTSPHVGSPLNAIAGAGNALFTGGAGGGVLRGVPTP